MTDFHSNLNKASNWILWVMQHIFHCCAPVACPPETTKEHFSTKCCHSPYMFQAPCDNSCFGIGTFGVRIASHPQMWHTSSVLVYLSVYETRLLPHSCSYNWFEVSLFFLCCVFLYTLSMPPPSLKNSRSWSKPDLHRRASHPRWMCCSWHPEWSAS